MLTLNLSGAKKLYPMAPKRTRSISSANTAAVLGNAGRGGFAAGKVNGLTMDFLSPARSADQDLAGDSVRMRSRTRPISVDNPHGKKFLALLAQNVVGPRGITMKAEITSTTDKETAETKEINERIEKAWKRWGRVGRCTADGRSSFHGVQIQAIKNCGREGENIVKLVYGREFNEYGIALQLLDNDQLDDTMMQRLPNGCEIRMGVEVNKYRRPLAYWLYNGHPNDPLGDRTRTRVPAAEIVHTAIWERPAQTRGYTWMSAVILSLNQYSKFEEATQVAARHSAAKFAVIEQELPEGGSYTGEDDDEDDDSGDSAIAMNGNTGEIPIMDPGQSLNYIDPRFPTNTFKDFTRTTLRNIASGLLVSYPSLGNDLEGVNFSSIRAGLLDERDSWRIIQRWFIEQFLDPIFQAWLRTALLTELADLNLTADQREQITWKPRGWEWVDPEKDSAAAILDIENGLDTRENVLAERGLDFKPVMEQSKKEQDFIQKLGLKIGTDLKGDQGGTGIAPGDEATAATTAKPKA